MEKVYMCIDLKSFYASVECVERNLNPLTTNLVVADNTRTEKTICLAVTPSLKKYGLSGRSRLFEVVSKVKEINKDRLLKNGNKPFKGKSYDDIDLESNKDLELDYIAAPPRMGLYMKYSSKIYSIYLKYLSPDDICVYSIDEVFCDITDYLKYYNMNPKQLVSKIIKNVVEETGITATAGIGTNMYLAKVAMDIVAKHKDADELGVRIAELNEYSYREHLWDHKPLTSFWRVGRGIASKLEEYGMHTMGDVARMSIKNEDLLYRLFGVNAETLIDHAWGYECTTIKEAKSYMPSTNSLSKGQVLHHPYTYEKTRLIVKEMADLVALELSEKHVLTKKLVLTIGYDTSNLTTPYIMNNYAGKTTFDVYGREVPKPAHGTINTDYYTSSSLVITKKLLELFDRIVDPILLVRRVNIATMEVIDEGSVPKQVVYKQLDLFSNNDIEKEIKEKEKAEDEAVLQHVILDLKKKYGKNSIVKGMNLEEGGTTLERNREIGGHKA